MAETRNLRMTVQYDGTDFAGYQVQPGTRTVQGVLQEAFRRLTGEEVRAHAAGRTDAGGHALGQVVSVHTSTALPCSVVERGLNALLPPDVAVRSVQEAGPEFHARFSAQSRSYVYFVYNSRTPAPLWRRYSYHVTGALDTGT